MIYKDKQNVLFGDQNIIAKLYEGEMKIIEDANIECFNQILCSSRSKFNDSDENVCKQSLRNFNVEASRNKLNTITATLVGLQGHSALSPKLIDCSINKSLVQIIHKVLVTGCISSFLLNQELLLLKAVKAWMMY